MEDENRKKLQKYTISHYNKNEYRTGRMKNMCFEQRIKKVKVESYHEYLHFYDITVYTKDHHFPKTNIKINANFLQEQGAMKQFRAHRKIEKWLMGHKDLVVKIIQLQRYDFFVDCEVCHTDLSSMSNNWVKRCKEHYHCDDCGSFEDGRRIRFSDGIYCNPCHVKKWKSVIFTGDTTKQQEAICPHCGHEEQDTWEKEEGVQECEYCTRTYMLIKEGYLVYTTEKIAEEQVS